MRYFNVVCGPVHPSRDAEPSAQGCLFATGYCSFALRRMTAGHRWSDAFNRRRLSANRRRLALNRRQVADDQPHLFAGWGSAEV